LSSCLRPMRSLVFGYRCRSQGTVRHRSGHFAILLLIAIGAFVPEAARAIEWSLEPYVTARTIYNDNFTLTTGPHSDVWGILLAPGVKLNAESEIFKVTGEADVSVNRYSDSQFNTTEGALSLHSDYRAERNTYGLNFHLIRDNTLVGELATTGVAQAYSPRTELLINPSWTRALTESTRLNLNYGYTQVNYGETSGTSLIDFSTQRPVLDTVVGHTQNTAMP